ncbi:portal protein [uncultured Desulfovibrio sp.]|uniref:portal protein n=1 Tax=uncultured Desulfovibrio sp. TaxID=167968 RepID=UPI0026706296|nr:portal protein [uncultured Desulfovibrio sp.]
MNLNPAEPLMETPCIIPYAPRPLQWRFHQQRTRFCVLLCHRRFGKTVAAVNDLLRAALRTSRTDWRAAYAAPYLGQAKAVAWDYLRHFAGVIPGTRFHEGELRCDLPNGARIRLYGTDNAQALRGLYLDDLVLDEPDLSRSHAGQRYLDEVEARMRVVLQRCNFYNAMHTIYAELGTFGTVFVFELADLRHGFRFVPLCAGQYVLDTDAARRVDTVFHRMHMSLRQMVQSFGPEALPENLRLAARRTPDQRHAVIHAVLPRTERLPRLAGPCHMPWASVYWLEGREGQVVPLKESGFLGFPGFGPRWDVAANDVYGRSPAMDALPDCRMLQQMGITTLKAIHKAVDPPMSVHAGLRSVGLDLTPGGINFVDSLPGQSQPVATPLLQVKPDLAQARSAMEAVQQQIRAGLYNDLFRLILEGRSKVTASEIAAREEEKLLLIGPVLERLHDELLIPLIDRTFRLMLALDMLPPCPPELSGRHLKVEFVSLLAQAQKLVGISATDQYLALTLKAASAWPEALDSVDVDNLLDNYAQSLGLPANLTRPREERARMRAGREEARQAEQQLELLQKAADLGHTLADSGLTVEGEKSSVLQVLANLAAGASPALRPQQPNGMTPPPGGQA